MPDDAYRSNTVRKMSIGVRSAARSRARHRNGKTTQSRSTNLVPVQTGRRRPATRDYISTRHDQAHPAHRRHRDRSWDRGRGHRGARRFHRVRTPGRERQLRPARPGDRSACQFLLAHRHRRDQRVVDSRARAGRRPLAVAAAGACERHRLPEAIGREGHRVRRPVRRARRRPRIDRQRPDDQRRRFRPASGRRRAAGGQRRAARRRDLRGTREREDRRNGRRSARCSRAAATEPGAGFQSGPNSICRSTSSRPRPRRSATTTWRAIGSDAARRALPFIEHKGAVRSVARRRRRTRVCGRDQRERAPEGEVLAHRRDTRPDARRTGGDRRRRAAVAAGALPIHAARPRRRRRTVDLSDLLVLRRACCRKTT